MHTHTHTHTPSPVCTHTQPHSSVCLPVCLSACLTACLPVCLSVCLPACLPPCLFVCLPACVSVCLPACLPTCLPVCLPACLPACVSSCLPACLPACLFVCLTLFRGCSCFGDSLCQQRYCCTRFYVLPVTTSIPTITFFNKSAHSIIMDAISFDNISGFSYGLSIGRSVVVRITTELLLGQKIVKVLVKLPVDSSYARITVLA